MSFAALKANRANAIAALVTAAESTESKSYGDDRFWSPTVDKAGNGYAIIRFLPAPAGEDIPWVRYWDHGFKGPTGKWYIENSLTSIGQQDPVSEHNTGLWNSGVEDDKKIVRERKRRLHYVSNILVVSDPANTENEGKVFLYKYGKKIFDKVMDLMQPQFPGEQPVNPFDFWTGAAFKLKIRNVEGFRNYDKSEFDKPGALFGGDEKQLELVYNQLNSLKDFTDPKNYKPYAELKKKFYEVIGEEAVAASLPETTRQDLNTTRAAAPRNDPKPATKPAGKPAQTAVPDEPDFGSEGGDGKTEDLGYFARLAQGG